jgi:hypothetical protein
MNGKVRTHGQRMKFCLRLALVAGCSLALTGSVLRAQEPQENRIEPFSTVASFEFHSGFWINLHHFLYAQTLPPTRSGPPLQGPELSSSEQKVWDQAVSFYRQHLAQRDFVQDEELQQIDYELGKMESAPDISCNALKSELCAVLRSAAPVFRLHWWPQHDTANRFWIRMAQPLVATLAEQMRTQMAKAFETEWPASLIRVDVVEYANWAGAYTNMDPGSRIHTVMSSDTPGYQSFAAIEMLFHEASHGIVYSRQGRVAEAIRDQAKAHGIGVPDGFWHALIFYTAGEFARRDLNRLGIHDYEPYATKQGLWWGAWRDYYYALALFWRAHMDGNMSLDEALSQIMKTLAVTAPAGT